MNRRRKIIVALFFVVVLASVLISCSLGLIFLSPRERFEDAEVWIDTASLPGGRINLFVASNLQITNDIPTHIVHGFSTDELWDDMTIAEQTEFISTNEFRFFFKGEEIALRHITRYDTETGYMFSLFYRVFPPGYFPVGNHEIRGEWYRLHQGEWEAFEKRGILKVKPQADPDLDSDGDYLSNAEELNVYLTDAMNPDTDADGLIDGEEVFGTWGYLTDPLSPDTDADGLRDNEEYAVGTNPTNPDCDADGLTDGDEVLNYFTNPHNWDTDGDTWWDGEEVNFGFDPKDPLDPGPFDSDLDGLSDGEEVIVYGTDPLDPDTDADGIWDGAEVTNGTDPLDPNDPPP